MGTYLRQLRQEPIPLLTFAMQLFKAGIVLSNLVLLASAAANDSSACPGYEASNVKQSGATLSADLTLAGSPCNAYGTDLTDLKLLVEYQTGMEAVPASIGWDD